MENGDRKQGKEREQEGSGPKAVARLIVEMDENGNVRIGGGAEKNPILAYGLLSSARLLVDSQAQVGPAKEPSKILRPEFGGIPGGGPPLKS